MGTCQKRALHPLELVLQLVNYMKWAVGTKLGSYMKWVVGIKLEPLVKAVQALSPVFSPRKVFLFVNERVAV